MTPFKLERPVRPRSPDDLLGRIAGELAPRSLSRGRFDHLRCEVWLAPPRARGLPVASHELDFIVSRPPWRLQALSDLAQTQSKGFPSSAPGDRMVRCGSSSACSSSLPGSSCPPG